MSEPSVWFVLNQNAIFPEVPSGHPDIDRSLLKNTLADCSKGICKLLLEFTCESFVEPELPLGRGPDIVPTAVLFILQHDRLNRRSGVPRFSVFGKQFAQMASSFSMTRVIEFCETDMAGIAHFSNFYRWMEQAEHAFFRSLGLTIANEQSDGTTIGFPRVSASCRFMSPAKFEDELTVQLQVQRIGVKSLTYEAIFSIGERLVAQGVLKTACCQFRPGELLQSIVIPDLYLSKIEEYSD